MEKGIGEEYSQEHQTHGENLASRHEEACGDLLADGVGAFDTELEGDGESREHEETDHTKHDRERDLVSWREEEQHHQSVLRAPRTHTQKRENKK